VKEWIGVTLRPKDNSFEGVGVDGCDWGWVLEYRAVAAFTPDPFFPEKVKSKRQSFVGVTYLQNSHFVFLHLSREDKTL
jgi:hypothetical protein